MSQPLHLALWAAPRLRLGIARVALPAWRGCNLCLLQRGARLQAGLHLVSEQHQVYSAELQSVLQLG